MTDKPVRPGFLSLLSQATGDMPASVKDIVSKVIETRSFSDTLRYYEIRDEPMLQDLIAAVTVAIDKKMQSDFQRHRLGSTSFQSVIVQAIAFALVAGAELAKSKKI